MIEIYKVLSDMESVSRAVDYLFKSKTRATSELDNRSQVQIQDASR